MAAALALSAAGCASTPTPLSPGLSGPVGQAAYGVLVGGAILPPRGPGFRRLRPWADTNHGSETLVRVLEEAALRVSPSATDPPLVVGDMAGPHGGPLEGHHSHRTGRDVDLLFFYTTPGGVPVEAPGFVKVQADGLAFVSRDKGGPGFVRLDTARTWALARALLESSAAPVQWLFVSAEVEALLTEYARARGEPLELIWRAESVMHQPTDSEPHDDHFHLRLACTDDEAVRGCVTGSPRWPWYAEAPALADMQGEALARLLFDESAPSPGESSAPAAP